MKSLSFYTLALFLFLLSGCSWFGGNYDKVGEKKLFNGEVIEEFKLPNGLRVLVVPRHQAKVLTYQVWFQVGSIDEKLDPKLKKTGLAHLFEHMMFRGTTKFPDGVFDQLTSRLGGTNQNATTYFYRTNYYESIPSSQLEKLMEIEADRMENLKLDAELLEKEKGAVVGEYRRHMDSPVSVGNDVLLQTVFETSPYRYNVLGTEEEIKGFTLDEGNYFYKTYYAPNNATIVVVGDVEPKALMKMISKYYGHMKAQEVPHTLPPEEPPQKKERKKSHGHKQATSDTLLIAYRIPPVTSPDMIPLYLLSSHLSNGMEGRLRKLLVDTGIAVSANAGPSHRPDLYEIMIRLAENQSPQKAMAILDKEIELLKTKPISKEEFERALNQELLDSYGDITSNSSLANSMGEFLMMSGNYMLGFEILEGYKKLTPNDLMETAKKHLDSKQRTIVTIHPEGRGK